MSSISFSERLRQRFAPLTVRLGQALHRAHIHPDTLTWIGFLIVCLAAIPIVQGRFAIGGWILVAGSVFDVLDGATARARAQKNPFGGLLDSTLDRYADGVIFASLGYYFAGQSNGLMFVLVWVALVNSFAVSYVRARASSPDVGVTVNVGLLSRFERLALLILGLWFHAWLLHLVLWLLALGSTVTAIQRMAYVRRQLD